MQTPPTERGIRRFWRPGLVAAWLGALCPLAQADPLVWRVTHGKNTLYLGGSIHMLRPSDYPLNSAYDQSYAQSARVLFETDIAATQSPEFQQQLMAAMALPAGQSLQTLLKPATYARLSAATEARGLPMMLFDGFKPAMLILTLTILELQKLGITSESGVEAHYSQRATQDGKPQGALESVAEQIAFLSEMGSGYEDRFVELSLADLDKIQPEINQMISAWKNGDSQQLSNQLLARYQKEVPALYQRLIVQRNLNWLKPLRLLLSTAETEWVLVGSAHLLGQDGLPNLLAAQGYTVERLQSTPAATAPKTPKTPDAAPPDVVHKDVVHKDVIRKDLEAPDKPRQPE